jgi:hypothetical protein
MKITKTQTEHLDHTKIEADSIIKPQSVFKDGVLTVNTSAVAMPIIRKEQITGDDIVRFIIESDEETEE